MRKKNWIETAENLSDTRDRNTTRTPASDGRIINNNPFSSSLWTGKPTNKIQQYDKCIV